MLVAQTDAPAPDDSGRLGRPEAAFPDAAPRFVDDTLARILLRLRAAAERDTNESILACQELLDGVAGVGPLAGNDRLRGFSDDVVGVDRSTRGSTYLRYGALRGTVERLQRSLDGDAYQLATEASAEALWNDFRRSRDVSRLRMLVDRYFNSSRGDDACVMLAALALDRGDPVEAYALLNRVRSEHPRPDIDQRSLRLRLLVAAARLGDVEEVRADWTNLDRDGLADRVPARVRRELRRVTSDEPPAAPQRGAWSSAAGTSDGRRHAPRIGDAVLPEDRLTEAWSVPLDTGDKSGSFDAIDVMPGWTQLKRSPVVNAVALDERIYLHGRDGISCREAETGRVLWEGRRLALGTEPMVKRFGAKQAALAWVSREPTDDELDRFSDRVQAEFSVHGDRVFVIESASALKLSSASLILTTQKRVRRNVLTAYDAVTGRSLWSRPADEARRDAGGFLGAPSAYNDLLLAPASFSGEVWLLGLDRETGETRWRTFVCDEPAGGASFWSPVRVVVEGSAACVLPGTGVVACLDATTGDPRWAVRYQRSLNLDIGREVRAKNPEPTFDFYGWERDTLIVTGRLLIVAPSDTERLFALDRRDGSLVWEASARPSPDSPRASLVLGATGNRLFVAGHDVLRQYRITDGEPIWETPLAGATGQGLVTPDAVYVPVRSTLAVVDPATGERRRSIEFVSGYGKPLGNLATDGKRLYAAGATRALALAPLDEELELLAKRIEEGNVAARLHRSILLLGLRRDDEAFGDLSAAAAALRAPLSESETAASILEVLDQSVFDEERPGRVLREIGGGGLARIPGLESEEQRNLVGSWQSVARDCLASISKKERSGAVREILAVATLANDVSIQNLAEQALLDTVTADDLPTLDAAIESSPASRTIAVHALSSKRLTGVDGITERLDALWKADDPVLRLASAASLLAREDRRALDRLVTLLESEDAEVRGRAVGRLWRATGQRLAFDARAPVAKRLRQIAAWRAWIDVSGAVAEIRTDVVFTRTWGRTLVASMLEDSVAEFDLAGKETWRVELEDADRCWGMATGERVVSSWNASALVVYAPGDGPPRELWRLRERCEGIPLPNGDILVHDLWHVRRYDRTGRELWKTRVLWEGKLRRPLDVDILPNGNVRVLFKKAFKPGPEIADTAVEMDESGRVVRELPYDPKDKLLARLPNGNALVRIEDTSGEWPRVGRRIEERDPTGKVVWSYTSENPVRSAQRLPNGDTLITGGASTPVSAISPDGETVTWTLRSISDWYGPNCAHQY